MKFKTIGEIETRKAAILEEMKAEGADLDALKKEMEELRENAEELKKAAEKAEETRKAIAAGAAGIVVTEAVQAERKPVSVDEIRSSKEYIEAYSNYVKSCLRGNPDDKECRALLTTNATAATGYVPVPTLVDDIVRHAWENENILARVKKTGFTGNVKVAFEKTADPAYVHSEGATAHTEEALTLGIVEIKPENIKKWITVSDEMMETTGEGFLTYVYEELAYQVMKKLSYDVVADIKDCAYTSHQATAVGIPIVKKNPGIMTIAKAVANLSDEAQNLCILMNPLTKVAFQEAYAAGNFAVDPFQGLPVIPTGAIPAIDTLSENGIYAIVGDLSAEQVNFPAGEGLKLIQDPYSLAERDLVKIVGRVYAGHAVTAPGRLVRLAKEGTPAST
ncbi:MAG: phage major capsid protein [Clostridia bacterium]|nr:phage major capsid protein [Clostridia bacterium]